MPSIVQKLEKQKLVTPPKFLSDNVHYEVLMGSIAYAVSTDVSDIDLYGFCIPPKHIVFPHLAGEILGFGRQHKRFEVWQQHHIKDASSRTTYDVSIFSIVRFFDLCMKNKPNTIDALFAPRRCVLHSTQIGEHVREHRKEFLHKGSWHTFRGYAYGQVHKMNTKVPEEGSTRYQSVKKFGYDLKFAYNVVRLLNEVEQILTEHDLDLERNREQLKSIRRGEWKQKQIVEYFEVKEKELESLYTKSSLPHSPDEEKIKRILLECLEIHYGSIDDAIKIKVPVIEIIDNIIENLEILKKSL